MSRYLATFTLVLALLGSFVPDARAQNPLNVTALPAPCPSATPNYALDDDAPAFKCAIGLLPADGGEIYIPAGTYNLASTVSVPVELSPGVLGPERSVAFRGEGQKITRLVWSHAGDGLSFKSTSPTINKTLSVRSLSLIQRTANDGAAIKGEWPRTHPPDGHASFGVVTATIDDVHIGTDPLPPSSEAFWKFGVQLLNATAAKISLFNIQGQANNRGVAGIQLTRDDGLPATGAGVISTQIRNGAIMKYVRGIEMNDLSEGLHVQDVLVRDVGYGIQVTDGLGTTIANNEILARVCGIDLTRASSMNVTNNLIYDVGTEAFTGIAIRGPGPETPSGYGGHNHIMGNSIHSNSTTYERKGIDLDAPAGGTLLFPVLQGNNTSNMSKGIVLTANVSGAMILGNINTAAGLKIDGTGVNTTFDTNHE